MYWHKNDIIRKLDQAYEKGHNQRLYLTTMEVMDKGICSVDVCIYDEEKEEIGDYLFQISNIRAITENIDYKIPFRSYFKKQKIKATVDYTFLTYAPLYCDREFVLRKETGITKEDIYNCANYFFQKVLGYSWIWNIEVLNEKDIKELNKNIYLIKLDLLSKKEKGKETRVTRKWINKFFGKKKKRGKK